MATIPPAQVKIEIADAGPTVMHERGGFIGAGLEWDDRTNRIRAFEPQRNENGVYGIVYEAALKAAICRWDIEPHDIVRPAGVSLADVDSDMFDADEETGFAWDTRDEYHPTTGELVRPTSIRGMWKVTRPAWNYGRLAWEQFDTTDAAADWYLRSLTKIPSGRALSLNVWRGAPPPAEAIDGLLVYYTAIRFGGKYELQIVRGSEARLRKRVGGEWVVVEEWSWDFGGFYKDEAEKHAEWIGIFPMDGRLLFKTSMSPESHVYEEQRPIGLPEAEIAFAGNGGRAGFGLHEIAFDDRELNFLLATRPTQMPYRPSVTPDPVVVGHVPEGTTAEVLQVDDDGDGHQPDTRSRYTLALRLAPSSDRRRTPAVRMFGLSYAPVVTAPSIAWEDVTDRHLGLTGSLQYDIERRVVLGEASVNLDNSDGRFADVRQAKLLRVSIGRDGLTGRYSGVAVPEVPRDGRVSSTARLRMRDRLADIWDAPFGYRRPFDGMKVCVAIPEALRVGGAHASEIGVMYDSEARLPTSAYAAENWAAEAAGALDTGKAAVMFRQTATVGEVLTYMMAFDYGTYIAWHPTLGQFVYGPLELSGAPARTFTEAEDLDGQDAIRRGTVRHPRLHDVATLFLAEGRDRRTQEKLGASAWDRDKVQEPETVGYRATDRDRTEQDEGLGEQRQVNLRCRYLYEMYHRLREERGFECLGQELLWAGTRIEVDETKSGPAGEYFVLDIHDEVDAEGGYTGHIDAAAWEAA